MSHPYKSQAAASRQVKLKAFGGEVVDTGLKGDIKLPSDPDEETATDSELAAFRKYMDDVTKINPESPFQRRKRDILENKRK